MTHTSTSLFAVAAVLALTAMPSDAWALGGSNGPALNGALNGEALNGVMNGEALNSAMNGEALNGVFNGEALNTTMNGEALSGVAQDEPTAPSRAPQYANRRAQAPTAMRPVGLSFPNGTKIVLHY